MLGPRIPDEVVMRYADGELPWPLRLPLGSALLLSPRLRQRIREWRRFSATLRELGVGEADYHFIECRKGAYRVSTAALRWVIVVGVLVALYLFGMVTSHCPEGSRSPE